MEDGTKLYTFTIECPICGNEQELNMTQDELTEYMSIKGKTPIQEIFPDWPAKKRILLITGMCSNCWIVRNNEEV